MKRLKTFGRAAWLALILLQGSLSAAFAHALPGSMLTFSQQDDRLALSISLPLEDLLIAAPELASLAQGGNGARVSVEGVSALASYFADHLSIRQSSRHLKLSLLRASIQTSYNDHLGSYDLLTLHLDVGGADGRAVFPMTLVYDAVMHEVRNHRAKVYWAAGGTAPLGLAEFGFVAVNGVQSSIILRQPE